MSFYFPYLILNEEEMGIFMGKNRYLDQLRCHVNYVAIFYRILLLRKDSTIILIYKLACSTAAGDHAVRASFLVEGGIIVV